MYNNQISGAKTNDHAITKTTTTIYNVSIYDLVFNIYTILKLNTPPTQHYSLPDLKHIYTNLLDGSLEKDMSYAYQYGILPDINLSRFKTLINRFSSYQQAVKTGRRINMDPDIVYQYNLNTANNFTNDLTVYQSTGIII
jgi:hypothetical protein